MCVRFEHEMRKRNETNTNTQSESEKQVKEGDVLATKLQKLDADYKLQAEQCEAISNENQVKAAELKVRHKICSER